MQNALYVAPTMCFSEKYYPPYNADYAAKENLPFTVNQIAVSHNFFESRSPHATAVAGSASVSAFLLFKNINNKKQNHCKS